MEKVGDSEEPCPTPTLGQLKIGDVLPLKTKDEVHGPKYADVNSHSLRLKPALLMIWMRRLWLTEGKN